MKRRAMWRWKSFWLGLLVLVFLSWAWARSMTWMDSFTWRYWEAATKMGIECDHDRLTLEQGLGQIRLSWASLDPFAEDGWSHWSALLESMRPMEALLMPDADDPMWESDPGGAPDSVGNGAAAAGDPFGADDPFTPWSIAAAVKEPERGPFPEVLEMNSDGVVVAHWLLCAVFSVAWAGWLGWRWWRMRRLTEAEMEAEVSR